MLIIGCDFHTRYQQIAMANDETGELVLQRRLDHQSGEAEAFYRDLPKPVRVGIEATGPIHWFVRLLSELGGNGRKWGRKWGQTGRSLSPSRVSSFEYIYLLTNSTFQYTMVHVLSRTLRTFHVAPNPTESFTGTFTPLSRIGD